MKIEKRYPKVTIAILNYNGKKYLKNCFNSIKKIDYPNYEVVLIDNNSGDDSIAYVKEKFHFVKIFSFRENLGFAKAYNNAISKIDSQYILILNNDVIVEKSFLSPLILKMLEDDANAVVGCKILMMKKSKNIAHAGGKITVIGSGIDRGWMNDKKKFNDKQYVGFCCGACFLVKKSAYEVVNGFDNDYFAYNEDVDLCWRLWLKGYKIVYEPTSNIQHICSGSWTNYSFDKIFFGQYSRLTNMLKNLEFKTLILAIPLSIFYDFVLIMKNIFERDNTVSKAIIKANISIISELKKILKKRHEIQSNRQIDDSFLFKNGYIASLGESIKEFLKTKIFNMII